MCGLAGFLVTDPREIPSHESASRRLSAMASAIAHRGPDRTGLWIGPDRRVGLAHRRLTILDLSPKADQPMTDVDETLVVSFNGEIYNHLALRRQLQDAGRRFRTDHSDTEVLIHGYAAWGVDGLLRRLDGMFAFALWDGRDRRLILARDRVGIKPLYLHVGSHRTTFASEIKALFADPEIARAVNPAALSHYLTFRAAPAPLTLFRDIFKLPAGHVAEVTTGGQWRMRRYWQPVVGSPVSGDGLTEKVREALDRAVQEQAVADVPMGVFLSGGIDSTAIATLAAQGDNPPPYSFTVGFSDHPHLNEFDQAAAVARRIGSRHHAVAIGCRDMEASIETIVRHQDEPLADWVCVPLYFVAGLARENGVKTVLVGEGADELFCGYPGYLSHLKFVRRYRDRLDRLPRWLRRIVADLAAGMAPISRRAESYVDLFDRIARDRESFLGGAIGFNKTDKRPLLLRDLLPGAAVEPPEWLGAGRLLSGDPSDAVDHFLGPLRDAAPEADELTRMIHVEFMQRLPELLLMRVDKMTMAHGVEARVPFLDRRLVELVANLPMELRIPGGEPKGLLKAALAGIVPESTLRRKKIGFGAPMAEWLREDFGERARERILDGTLSGTGWFDNGRIEALFSDHAAERHDRSVQLWTLYNLAVWHDQWFSR